MKLPVLPWYKEGLSFQCTQCGNCCTGGPGYVWMSSQEVDRLAEHLKLPREDVLKKHCRSIGGKISLKETKTEGGLYDCVFLTTSQDATGKTKRGCSIYPVRPLQCRTWPFWDGLLASKESWTRTKRMCPGMDKGKAYTFERIEELRTAKDWPESPPSSK
jgi:Fe-S-cluster containining protein